MSEIANTNHLSQKDKDRLEYFFEKYSLAWYIEREYKRLQHPNLRMFGNKEIQC